MQLDRFKIWVKFDPIPAEAGMFMPSKCTIELAFVDEGVPSRRAAMDQLIDVARNVLDTIRVTQPATGLPGTLPHLEQVLFSSNGEPQPLGFDWYAGYRPVAMLVRSEDTQPHVEDFLRVIGGEVNEDWDLDILSSQARHYAQNNWDSNPALSLFQAALVAETKMKRVLWRDTRPDLQAALSLVVPRKSALKHDVLSLFSSVSEAFLGRSLKIERPALWKQTRIIFERRNEFVHQAKLVSHDEAQQAVTCARWVALWADDGAVQNYRH